MRFEQEYNTRREVCLHTQCERTICYRVLSTSLKHIDSLLKLGISLCRYRNRYFAENMYTPGQVCVCFSLVNKARSASVRCY